MSTAWRWPAAPEVSVQLVPPFVERIRTILGLPPASGRPNVPVAGLMSTRSCQATKMVPLPVTDAVGKPFERNATSAGGLGEFVVENVGWSNADNAVPGISCGLLKVWPKFVERATSIVSGV